MNLFSRKKLPQSTDNDNVTKKQMRRKLWKNNADPSTKIFMNTSFKRQVCMMNDNAVFKSQSPYAVKRTGIGVCAAKRSL